MIKKQIILAIFILSTLVNFGQKYDDIIEIVNRKDYQKAYSLLFEYQHNNPDFANTYFQLGNISYYWALNSDPLTDLNQTEYYIRHTKLFYSLAINKLELQPKDAKRNDKFYKTVPELLSIDRLENQMVIDYINNKLDKINEFDTKTHETVNYFQNLVNSYNKTKTTFIQIVSQNNNLNDIYIQPKVSTFAKTNKIILNFDSTLYFYDLYKNSLTNYPIKNYNQTLVQRPIKTYRLQGLTGFNFLYDTIYIWDYKNWAKSIQDKLNADISHFRETIIKTNKELTAKDIKLTNSHDFSNSYEKYILDQKIIFEVEKYDFNSVISALFRYRTAKIDFLVQVKKTYNDTSNYSYSALNRAVEYNQLSIKKQILDSLIIELNTKITYDNYLKHKDFFDFNYKGFDGLKDFITIEKSNNYTLFSESIENLKFFVFRDVFSRTNKPLNIEYNNKNINLFTTQINPSEAITDEYYTLATASFNNEKYITGYYKTYSGTTSFIAKIVNGQVEWLKNTTSGPSAIDFGNTITANKNGCFVIIHSFNNNQHKNILIQLSTTGQQTYKKVLSNNSMPRFINYDDINSQILLAFHGFNFNYFNESSDTLELKRINIQTNEIEIDKKITLQGNIINIIKIDTTYNLYANYTRLTIGQVNLLNHKGNVVHIKCTTNGTLIEANELKTSNFIWVIHAFKINNETINILGLTRKTDINKTLFINLPALYYVSQAPNGTIKFENFE